MSVHGPHIRWLRTEPGVFVQMSPERDRLLMFELLPEGGGKVVSVGLPAAGDRKEVLRVPGTLGQVECGGDACAAESVDRADGYSIFESRGAGPSKKLLGPWKAPRIARHGVTTTPQGAVLVVADRIAPPEQKGKREVFYVVVAGTVRGPVDLGADPWEVLAFEPSAKGLGVKVRQRSESDRDAPFSYVSVDVTTLAVTPSTGPAHDVKGMSSPDGRYAVIFTYETLRFVDLAKGQERSVAVNELDRPLIAEHLGDTGFSWASNRFLFCRGRSAMFVDREQLTFNKAFPDDDRSDLPLVFDKAFSFAIETHDGYARLGRITSDR